MKSMASLSTAVRVLGGDIIPRYRNKKMMLFNYGHSETSCSHTLLADLGDQLNTAGEQLLRPTHC